jgi:hypothetical protein
MDYVWGMSSGRLAFANGIKMKMSVIFGIFHMNLGILVKGTNAMFKRNWPVFLLEVVGGLVILNGLFGWMDILVFAKWGLSINLFEYLDVTQGTPAKASDINIGRIYGASDIHGTPEISALEACKKYIDMTPAPTATELYLNNCLVPFALKAGEESLAISKTGFSFLFTSTHIMDPVAPATVGLPLM